MVTRERLQVIHARNKKPAKSRLFYYLVEAAGIEPASANSPLLGLHVYPIFLLNCFTPDRRGVKAASPEDLAV